MLLHIFKQEYHHHHQVICVAPLKVHFKHLCIAMKNMQGLALNLCFNNITICNRAVDLLFHQTAVICKLRAAKRSNSTHRTPQTLWEHLTQLFPLSGNTQNHVRSLLEYFLRASCIFLSFSLFFCLFYLCHITLIKCCKGQKSQITL